MKGKNQIGLTFGICCLLVILPCAGYGANLTIGNTISTTGIDGVEISTGSPVYVNSSGQLGTVTSPGTITVNCSATPPESLQSAVDAAQTGDTINVTGICNENIVIREEKQRLTLDGQNVAVLNGVSSSNTLNVYGKGIVIRNFYGSGGITGGANGIAILEGASATINRNNIYSTGSSGIYVSRTSFAVIINNDIHNNPNGNGIHVAESSAARIGFSSTGDASARPNNIHANGIRGIVVTQSSRAWIAGNTIADNENDGIGVLRLSSADIASNTINNNGVGASCEDGTNCGSGVLVRHNSVIHLGEDNPVGFLDQPNITTTNNKRYGVECSGGAFVDVHLGSTNQINGAKGQTSIASNCPNIIETP